MGKLNAAVATVLILIYIAIVAHAIVVNGHATAQEPDTCSGYYAKAQEEVRSFENGGGSFATMYATMYLACRKTTE